ncbi:capsid protein [Water buffalo astrovirus]|nr:capsid protein [Water buffalo astrovirus]
MAEHKSQHKSQGPKNVKEVVETKKVVKTIQPKASQQKRHDAWRKRKGPKNQVNSGKIKRELKKQGLEGPAPKFSVTVSATIGKVGPNKSQGPELQIATFLHPSLIKEPNDGTNFGPLQAAAAQYGLWRISYLEVRFTPLVGASAVTGSVVRASLNLTQSPGATSWGGLGARKHLNVPTGSSKTWRLKRGDLTGPRSTYWVTNTNEEGGQSCGPMLEIHELGKTTSTYKDADWQGDLFMVEIYGRWEFANYNAQPALGMLERLTDDVQVELGVDSDGQITMTVPENSPMARHMGEKYELPSNAASVGETIWQVVDEGAGLLSTVAPQPFGWLIKGGWWFVKKLLGRSYNAGSTYLVYPSLADAQNGKPAISTSRGYTRQAVQTTLTSTQINAPNTGPGVSQPSLAAYDLFPYFPHDEPQVGLPFYLASCYEPGLSKGAVPIWVYGHSSGYNGSPFEVTLGSETYQTQTFSHLFRPVAFSADIPHQASSEDVSLNGWYTIDTLPPIGDFKASFSWPINKTKYGDVIAATNYFLTSNLMLAHYLVRVTESFPSFSGDEWSSGATINYFTPMVNAIAAAPDGSNPVNFTADRLVFQQLQKSTVGVPSLVRVQAGSYILATAWCRGTAFSAGLITGYGFLNHTAFNVENNILRADSNGVLSFVTKASPYLGLAVTRMTRGVPPTDTDELVARVLQQLQRRYRFASDTESESEDDPDEFECLRSTPLQNVYEGVRAMRIGHAEAAAVVRKLKSRGHAE